MFPDSYIDHMQIYQINSMSSYFDVPLTCPIVSSRSLSTAFLMNSLRDDLTRHGPPMSS